VRCWGGPHMGWLLVLGVVLAAAIGVLAAMVKRPSRLTTKDLCLCFCYRPCLGYITLLTERGKSNAGKSASPPVQKISPSPQTSANFATQDPSGHTSGPEPSPPAIINPPQATQHHTDRSTPSNPVSTSGDTLYAKQSLSVDQPLASRDRRYKLVLQKDSNLVVRGPYGEAVWESNMLGRGAARLHNQLDGIRSAPLALVAGQTPTSLCRTMVVPWYMHLATVRSGTAEEERKGSAPKP